MQFKYCENKSFEDFASGRVIITKSGMTNFPVRLAQEIYCRCLGYLKNTENICLYDPCGGGGYLLTTLGFLNYDSLKTIVCSDVDKNALEVAKQNLNLLSDIGFKNRVAQLENLYKQYGKLSHLEALDSAKILRCNLDKYTNKPNILLYHIDILKNEALKNMQFKADIIFTDVPYGNLVSWQGEVKDAINVFLSNLIPVLKSTSVIAICSDKQQKIKHDKFARLEKCQLGKRKFELLSLK